MFDLSIFSGNTALKSRDTNDTNDTKQNSNYTAGVTKNGTSYPIKNSDLYNALTRMTPMTPKKQGHRGKNGFFLENATPLEVENFTECVLEREAIMIVDGGLPPEEAHSRANVICIEEWQRRRGHERKRTA